jgi:hypothetical protein
MRDAGIILVLWFAPSQPPPTVKWLLNLLQGSYGFDWDNDTTEI